jgi:hypothetical protein
MAHGTASLAACCCYGKKIKKTGGPVFVVVAVLTLLWAHASNVYFAFFFSGLLLCLHACWC